MDSPEIDESQPVRGSVWFVDLGVPMGHEEGNDRPAVIVSANPYNTASRGLVAVVPITKSLRQHPLRVRIDPPQAGLQYPSDVLCDQLRTVTVKRLRRRLGALDDTTMKMIAIKLRLFLNV